VSAPIQPGDYAISIEAGWLGKVVAVEDGSTPGLAGLLKMQGVNRLSRALLGGDIEDHLDADDTQWFAPKDVRLVKPV